MLHIAQHPRPTTEPITTAIIVPSPSKAWVSIQELLRLTSTQLQTLPSTWVSICLAFAIDFLSLFCDFRSSGITAYDRLHIFGLNHTQNQQPLFACCTYEKWPPMIRICLRGLNCSSLTTPTHWCLFIHYRHQIAY